MTIEDRIDRCEIDCEILKFRLFTQQIRRRLWLKEFIRKMTGMWL
jgi:hypothetical protein